jgi:hypothetical protein
MPVDVAAAERFMYENARLLERRRLAVLLHGDPVAPVLEALRPYRNDDGGFGHALEPDVRGPHSEPTATLQALEVLSEIGALEDPLVARAADWIASLADADGGVPSVVPASAAYPHAPWMQPAAGSSFLAFALAGMLWQAGAEHPWRERATSWCWRALADPDRLSAYWVNFALVFLDNVPHGERAAAAIETLRGRLDADGSIPVSGGTADERLWPLDLSPRPGLRSRALFGDEQIEADLDRLERGQQKDGGWTFDWLAWSPAQAVEWRGLVTLRALQKLHAHGRLPLG